MQPATSISCVLLGALVAAILLCPDAAAESRARIVVSLRDLDPNDPDDARVLFERIKVAAEQVCRRTSDQDPALTPERWACIRGAIGKAVASIRSPALTRLAQQR